MATYHHKDGVNFSSHKDLIVTGWEPWLKFLKIFEIYPGIFLYASRAQSCGWKLNPPNWSPGVMLSRVTLSIFWLLNTFILSTAHNVPYDDY